MKRGIHRFDAFFVAGRSAAKTLEKRKLKVGSNLKPHSKMHLPNLDDYDVLRRTLILKRQHGPLQFAVAQSAYCPNTIFQPTWGAQGPSQILPPRLRHKTTPPKHFGVPLSCACEKFVQLNMNFSYHPSLSSLLTAMRLCANKLVIILTCPLSAAIINGVKHSLFSTHAKIFSTHKTSIIFF